MKKIKELYIVFEHRKIEYESNCYEINGIYKDLNEAIKVQKDCFNEYIKQENQLKYNKYKIIIKNKYEINIKYSDVIHKIGIAKININTKLEYLLKYSI